MVDMKNGENRGYKGRGRSARAAQLLQKCGMREEGTKGGTFASAASSDNTRRKRERERNTYETRILIITVIP